MPGKKAFAEFSRRIRMLRVAHRWGKKGSAKDLTVIPVEDSQDKRERLIRGMMFFLIPGSDGESPLSEATGASLILGNQDGKHLHLFVSLDDTETSYIGTVADHRLIPGNHILKHEHMDLARYKEYKDPDGTEKAEEDAENRRAKDSVARFEKWADMAALEAWKKNPAGRPFDPAGRDSDTLFLSSGKSREVLERFVGEDASFITDSGLYREDVVRKVGFVRELCESLFFQDPDWWFGTGSPGNAVLDTIFEGLVYEHPRIGVHVLGFRRDNLPEVLDMREKLDALLNDRRNDRDMLDLYLDTAVEATARLFDTKKILHTLSIVDAFDSLSVFMAGALAPDNAFHLGTLAGRDFLQEGGEVDDLKGIFDKIQDGIQDLVFQEMSGEDTVRTKKRLSDLFSLWHLVKAHEIKIMAGAKMKDVLEGKRDRLGGTKKTL